IGERLKGADKTVSRPRRLGIAPSPSGGRLGWGWGCTPCTYTLPLKPIPSLALPLKGRELLGPSQSSHDRRIGQTLVSPPAKPGVYLGELHRQSRLLEISFSDDVCYRLPGAFVRVYS